MNKLIDLRFVIGSFFLLIGLLLTVYHFVTAAEADVNLWCGISFSVFGVLMIILSLQKYARDDLPIT
jgi:hypothetical protein